MCVSMYLFAYTNSHTYMWIYIYIHTHTVLSIPLSLSLYMYIYIYIYLFICGATWTPGAPRPLQLLVTERLFPSSNGNYLKSQSPGVGSFDEPAHLRTATGAWRMCQQLGTAHASKPLGRPQPTDPHSLACVCLKVDPFVVGGASSQTLPEGGPGCTSDPNSLRNSGLPGITQ